MFPSSCGIRSLQRSLLPPQSPSVVTLSFHIPCTLEPGGWWLSSLTLTTALRLLLFSPLKPPLRHKPLWGTIPIHHSHRPLRSADSRSLFMPGSLSCPHHSRHYSWWLPYLHSCRRAGHAGAWAACPSCSSPPSHYVTTAVSCPRPSHASSFITSKILCLKHPTPFHLLSSALTLTSVSASTNLQPLSYAHHPPHVSLPSKVYNWNSSSAYTPSLLANLLSSTVLAC